MLIQSKRVLGSNPVGGPFRGLQARHVLAQFFLSLQNILGECCLCHLKSCISCFFVYLCFFFLLTQFHFFLVGRSTFLPLCLCSQLACFGFLILQFQLDILLCFLLLSEMPCSQLLCGFLLFCVLYLLDTVSFLFFKLNSRKI